MAGNRGKDNRAMPIRQDETSEPIAPDLIEALTLTISPERFNTYLVEAGHDPERAVRMYLWNAKLGQSFHFPLQALEVALRNAINRSLQNQFGKNWWDNERLKELFDVERRKDIDQVRRRLRYRKISVTQGQIVANLSFGFWHGMIRKRYNPMIWSKELRRAFPFLPKDQGRDRISENSARALILRNRIFHHEPLVRGRDLMGDYSAIIKVLSWISPPTAGWVRRHSSVPAVVRQKP